ncbi:MAG: M23 family metallopeptidase [Pyrinomonadaceae bacterium]
MQKNDKSYTFLLAHSSKKKNIYIKRVAVRKSYLHFGTVGIFLLLGISALSIGMSGIVRNAAFAQSAATTSAITTQIAAQPEYVPAAQPETTDYTRPSTPTDLALNSGGPDDGAEVDGEDNELENQLRAIRAKTNPAFLPTIWAHLGKINNEFGFRRNPFGGRSYEFHPGMDIDGERGDMVIAPGNGTVIKAGFTGGYGNMVEIDHGNGLTSRYGHMSKIETEVGAEITRGQLIGQVGSTGRSTGPHLHYELRLNDKSINPRHFLPAEPTDLTKIEKK